MKKAIKLILVEVSKDPKIVKDEKTGKTLTKYRHVFMTPEGRELIGFSDDEKYRENVTPALSWDESLAKDFLFNSTDWEGKERLTLINKTEADAFIKLLPKKTK